MTSIGIGIIITINDVTFGVKMMAWWPRVCGNDPDDDDDEGSSIIIDVAISPILCYFCVGDIPIDEGICVLGKKADYYYYYCCCVCVW